LRTTFAVTAAVIAIGLAFTCAVWLVPALTGERTRESRETQPTGVVSVDAPPVDGSEVLPPDDGAPPRDRLPREEAAPRISELPESASAQGSVVEGFPTELAGPADASDVLDSAVATEGDVMQFSLRARTATDAAAISAHYRALWSSLGLAAIPAGDGALSYRDDHSSVTIVTEEGGTGVVYVIHGVLRAA